ncbi:hypothetical protein DFH07DRAFT_761505, partial [Mycena maculata]
QYTSYPISALKSAHPNLAYIHLFEPRIHGDTVVEGEVNRMSASIISYFVIGLGKQRPVLRSRRQSPVRSGGFDQERGMQVADAGGRILIAYGRHFLVSVIPTEISKVASTLNPVHSQTFS